jgi:putative intracellular protease/amidase
MQLTGFSNSEEKSVEKEKYVPFLLEDRLKEQQGIYSKGDDWSSYVITDGTLVTGQNPMSSEEVAKAVLSVLRGGQPA